jgi:hypothetical protein
MLPLVLKRPVLLALVLLGLGGLALTVPASAQADSTKRVGLPRGIYDKPYIARMGSGTLLGGYMDHELLMGFDADDRLTTSTFRQHRFIPFLYSEITDRLHLAAEIEFEYGGDVSKGGEIKVEYAATDFAIRDWLIFRGGILLSPLGHFNLVHDSPVNDLTERPLVAREIIPTTLSESGIGFTGDIQPDDVNVIHYELYTVNGFTESILVKNAAGALQRVRLRGGRGTQRTDNNKNKALVGRLSWSPRLGVQLGGSFHTGAYSNEGEDRLTILAADAEVNRGPLQVQGEYAYARATLDAFNLEAQKQHGFYVQAGYHIPTDRLLAGSTFTLVGRYDLVDFGLGGGLSDQRQDRVTVGVNFRPVEDTVFKLDYGTNFTTAPGADRTRGAGQLAFSLATYF